MDDPARVAAERIQDRHKGDALGVELPTPDDFTGWCRVCEAAHHASLPCDPLLVATAFIELSQSYEALKVLRIHALEAHDSLAIQLREKEDDIVRRLREKVHEAEAYDISIFDHMSTAILSERLRGEMQWMPSGLHALVHAAAARLLTERDASNAWETRYIEADKLRDDLETRLEETAWLLREMKKDLDAAREDAEKWQKVRSLLE